MEQDKWYVNMYGSNEGRVYVGPLGATCGVAEVHTTAGREQALRDAETIVDAVNSVGELREQNRVLRSNLVNCAARLEAYYGEDYPAVRDAKAALTATSQPQPPNQGGPSVSCNIANCFTCKDATSQEGQG